MIILNRKTAQQSRFFFIDIVQIGYFKSAAGIIFFVHYFYPVPKIT